MSGDASLLGGVATDNPPPCHVCTRVLSKYACPRCGVRYCSVQCYRTHNGGQCADGLITETLADNLRTTRANDEEIKSMVDVLRRTKIGGGGGIEGWRGEEDDAGIAHDREGDNTGGLTQEELHELEAIDIPVEALLEELTDVERLDFERAMAAGSAAAAVGLTAWEPWWRDRRCLIQTVAATTDQQIANEMDGGNVMRGEGHVERDTTGAESDEAAASVGDERGGRTTAEAVEGGGGFTRGGAPSMHDAIVPFHRLAGTRTPSPALRNHCAEILYGYAFAARRVNGGVGTVGGAEEQTAAAEEALETSDALAGRPLPNGGVLEGVMDAAMGRVVQRVGGGTRGMAIMVLLDVAAIIGLGTTGVRLALSDLHHALRAEAAAKRGRRRVLKKVEYFLSWAGTVAPFEWEALADQVTALHTERAQHLPPLEGEEGRGRNLQRRKVP